MSHTTAVNIYKTVQGKSLEKQLKEAQEKLRSYEFAANGASEGLWDMDLRDRSVFISAPWANMLGYTLEEIESSENSWKKLLHPDDKNKAITSFEDYVTQKTSEYDIEFRMLHKNGHYVWVRSRAQLSFDEDGNPIRISGTHTDVTERKKTSELVQQSEKKYRGLFEKSLIGMMRVHKRNFEIIDMNEKARQILAYPDKPRYLKLKDLFIDENQLIALQDYLLRNESVEEYEIKVYRWDESETWLSFSVISVEGPESDYYDIIFRDISEFKENILELQRLNFELDNFVYHASHDIRSPLRSMMGLVDILKTENNPSQIKKVVEMMSGSINRLDKFVVDLLAMTRENRTDDDYVPVNFMVEVNNSITNFHHVYSTDMLDIRTHIEQAVPFHSDLTKIRIILNNLISNAIKYRRHDKDLHSYININVKVDEQNAELCIEDNGEGIPEDKLEKIFDMFYRASESSEGSGLGMYIVKNVIKKLNATIDVQSKEKKGTTFTVLIPNQFE